MMKTLIRFVPLVALLAMLVAWPAPSQTQHSVTLTWSASSTAGVHYNVYRGTTSGGPYTRLNTASLASTTYTDATGTGGTTYFYVITAVCDATTSCPTGISGESDFSAESNAVTFLGNPAAPGKPAATAN